ncbi:TPR repeat protein [Acinetobacter calcoaceticus]|uniref:TPR repeat protein n=1 Tax=Acinetobacter calcoaceticus TaxID=471 RepID=A0A4R1XUD4_ACICA|nr:TPR repeat protein [Acinetobacter calcoaceticus]
MKKILLASVIAVANIQAYSAQPATLPPQGDSIEIDPAFEKVKQLIQANDLTGAYKELERLGKTGNAQALYNLAYLNQAGQGTPQNFSKAVQYYEEAGKKGYSIANYVLAQNYATGGLGLKKDDKKSRDYLEKASAQGFSDATVELAVMLFAEGKAQSDKLALQKLDPLLKKGDYQAMHAKALYDISQGYVRKDAKLIEQGISTIQDLGKKGYIPALMAIGNMMTNGNIINQNLPEAKKIFAALAEQNVPQAKESLDAVNQLIAEKAKAPAKK